MTLGIGNLGNIGSLLPTAIAIETFGWRGTMWTSAVALLAISIYVFARSQEIE